MSATNQSFLSIDGIDKSFGSTEVLRNIQIEVEEGGFLVLVGPSGCGKSTLLNLIAGFESPTRGEIKLGGRSLLGLHPSQRDIAMVFQSYALYPNMNVADNIGFGMETRGVPKVERTKKISEVAEVLQIGQLLKRKPAQLSGGQRQRVAMGRALVRDPSVFLFDEPLSNLDARLRVDMRVEIKKLHDRLGTTIVYVTHDQIEAMTLATKIAVLNQGQVQQFGTPSEIYSEPANEFVADFMGSPAMNKSRGSLAIENNDVTVRLAGQSINVKHPSESLRELASRQADVMFGIRAEDVSIGASDAADASNVLAMDVGFIEPTGSDTFVTGQHRDMVLVARVANDLEVALGDTVNFKFDMEKSHFFSTEDGSRLS